MTDRKEIERIADLAGSDPFADPPAATPLTPDVRSGASFPFRGKGNADDALAPYVVIWAFSVAVASRQTFADAVISFERDLGDPPTIAHGLTYRGTYSVSVSSVAPDFEYRTIWGLASLENVQTLNDAIADQGNAKLQAMLKLIELRPPMRAEIMGLSKFTKIASVP
jgi:hypothetical protein